MPLINHDRSNILLEILVILGSVWQPPPFFSLLLKKHRLQNIFNFFLFFISYQQFFIII